MATILDRIMLRRQFAYTDPANIAQLGVCLKTFCPKAFATTSQRRPDGDRRRISTAPRLSDLAGKISIDHQPAKRYDPQNLGECR